ncbi:MAG: MBG domain-containing protein [Patescibacteria group bacterium]
MFLFGEETAATFYFNGFAYNGNLEPATESFITIGGVVPGIDWMIGTYWNDIYLASYSHFSWVNIFYVNPFKEIVATPAQRAVMEDKIINHIAQYGVVVNRQANHAKLWGYASNNPYGYYYVDSSAPATNCQKISGSGSNKIVFMRGSSFNAGVNDFLVKVDQAMIDLKKIDPYKTHWDKFSFYADLKKYDDVSFPQISYVIDNSGNGQSFYDVDPKTNIFSSSCANGTTETDVLLIKSRYLQPAWTTQFAKTIFLNDINVYVGDGQTSGTTPFGTFLARMLARTIGGLNRETTTIGINRDSQPINVITGSINDDFVYQSTAYTLFGGNTAKQVFTNCSLNPRTDYRGLDNKFYGGTTNRGCTYLNGTELSRPSEYYRPSATSILTANVLTTPTAPDGTNLSKFNVISCGFIVAGLNGETVTRANARKYWPQCLTLDTVKEGIPPVVAVPIINSVTNTPRTSLNSNSSIFGWIFQSAKTALLAAVGASNNISIMAGDTLTVSGSGFTDTENMAQLVSTQNSSNIYEVLGIASVDKLNISFEVPTTTPAGTYTLKVAAFNSSWSPVLATLSVSAYVPPPPPPPPKINQTITFDALQDRQINVVYSGTEFQNFARSSSGLPITYTVISGAAIINQGVSIKFTTAGDAVIRATQDGNVTYNPAPAVDRTFHVSKIPLTITSNFPAGTGLNKFINDFVDLVPTSPASGPVSLSVAGPGSLNALSNRLTFTGEGAVTVTASHGGDANYLPAPSVSVTFQIANPIPPPTLSAFDHPSAAVGSWIIVTGSGFSPSTIRNTDRVELSGVAPTRTVVAGISASPTGDFFVDPVRPNLVKGQYTAFQIPATTTPGVYSVRVANQDSPWSNTLSLTVLDSSNPAYAIASQRPPPVQMSFWLPNTAGTTTPTLNIPTVTAQVSAGQSITVRGQNFSPTGNKVQLTTPNLARPPITSSAASALLAAVTSSTTASTLTWTITDIPSTDGTSITFNLPSPASGLPSATYTLKVAASNSAWSNGISLQIFSRVAAVVEPVPAPVAVMATTPPPSIEMSSVSDDTSGPPPLPLGVVDVFIKSAASFTDPSVFNGTGTFDNPYGAPAGNLDAVMSNILPITNEMYVLRGQPEGTKVVIHLQNGTYITAGYSSNNTCGIGNGCLPQWTLPSNFSIEGETREGTIIRLAEGFFTNTNKTRLADIAVVMGDGYRWVSGARAVPLAEGLKNLTIDANYSTLVEKFNIAPFSKPVPENRTRVHGAHLFGEGNFVDNVRLKNIGNYYGTEGTESFGFLLLLSSHGVANPNTRYNASCSGDVTDIGCSRIVNSIYEETNLHSSLRNRRGLSTIFNITGSWDTDNPADVARRDVFMNRSVIANNIIRFTGVNGEDSAFQGYSVHHTYGGKVFNNIAENIAAGYYSDWWQDYNLEIYDNHFLGVSRGIDITTDRLPNFKKIGYNIHNNEITVVPINDGARAGIRIHRNSFNPADTVYYPPSPYARELRNFRIADNDIRLTSNPVGAFENSAMLITEVSGLELSGNTLDSRFNQDSNTLAEKYRYFYTPKMALDNGIHFNSGVSFSGNKNTFGASLDCVVPGTEIYLLATSTHQEHCLEEMRAADTPWARAILLSARTSASPSAIILEWNSDSAAQTYDVYRKTKNAGSWGSSIATLPASTLTYTDTTAGVGSVFEYRVVKTNTFGGTDEGYVLAGNKAPIVDSRGRVILVVDDTYVSDLNFELGRLREDLEGDGWTVARINVGRNVTPTSVRDMIRSKYNEDLANTSHVFLLGHVPVPYSGFVYYDGHPDHAGAWPADTFYADIDGTWTDTETSAGRDPCYPEIFCATVPNRIANFPGDGKWDQNIIPSKVEVAVGRVDFAEMPAFLPKTEKDLLRQYLNKDHLFRVGGINARGDKGGTFDNFGDRFFHYLDTWKDFTAFFGQNGFESVGNIFTGPTNNTPYLWMRAAGGGFAHGIYDGPTTNDIVAKGSRAVFNQMFGSYFGDFGYANNLMRAFIADQSYGLTSAWAGYFGWKFHRMGLGETIGDSTRLSENTDFSAPLYAGHNPQSYVVSYKWSGQSSPNRTTAMTLLGDPTLRLHMVKPPSNLTFSDTTGLLVLSWTASPDTDIVGYHVYRGSGDVGQFVRLTTGNPITTTSFVDTNAGSGRFRYMVKAVKLETSGSGSYYNTSQGVIKTVSTLAFGGPVSVQVIPSPTGGCALEECTPSGATIAPQTINIVGASPTAITTRQGEVFSVTYRYSGGPNPGVRGWTPFTFLVSADDSIVLNANDSLAGYPYLTFSQHTTTWTGGDRYETFSFKTPTNALPPGEYRLVTGLYDGVDRLTLGNPNKFPEGRGSYITSYEVAHVTVLAGEDRVPPGRSAITVPGASAEPSGGFLLPAGTTISGMVSATLSLATDESATCRYGTVGETAYSALTSTFTANNGGKSHSVTIPGLPNGSYRDYFVRCSDAAGNVNSRDTFVALRVAPSGGGAPFSVSVNAPAMATVERGSSVPVTITVQKTTEGAARPVTFYAGQEVSPGITFPSGSATVSPGVTAVFDPETCTPSPTTCSVALTITANNVALLTAGVPISVRLYDGPTPLTAFTFILTVAAPPPPPKSDQTITFDAQQDRQLNFTYGAANFQNFARSSSGLSITYTVVSGSAIIIPSAERVTPSIKFISAGDVVIRASQGGNTTYNSAIPVDRTFHVSKIPTTVTISNLAHTYTGDVKRGTVSTTAPSLNPAHIAVTYRQVSRYLFGFITIIDEETTAPTEAGEYEVTAIINDAEYAGTASARLIINKASQTITTNFPTALADREKTVGNYFDLTAISPATDEVTFSRTGPASITALGDRLMFTGAGTVRVTASDPGDNNYLPAPDVEVEFNVSNSTALISLTGLLQTYNGSPRSVGVSTNPASLAATITYGGSPTAPTNAGTYEVIATITSPGYTGTVTRSLVIQPLNQAITFAEIASAKGVGESFDLTASSNSGLPVTFVVRSGPASLALNGRTLSITGVGIVEIVASQGGNGNYSPATDVIRAFSTIKNTATVTLLNLAHTYNGDAKSATATTNPNLFLDSTGMTFTYIPVAPWWSFGLFGFGGSATAPTNVGSYNVTATINDPGYAGSATGVLVINKASQVINFAPPQLNKLVGSFVDLSATAPATGAVTLTVTGNGPRTLDGARLTFTGAGTVTVTASHLGDNNYFAAPDVVRTFNISKTVAQIQITRDSYVYDGASKNPLFTTDPVSLPTAISYQDSATTHVNVGTYNFGASINHAAYSGMIEGTLAITKASQIINFVDTPAGKTVGDVFTLDVSSNSSNPIQLSATGATLSGLGNKTVTITGTSVSITASQFETSNYFGATSVTKTFTAAKAPVVITMNNSAVTYDGSSKSLTYTTARPVAAVSLSYNGSATVPVNAGTYTVVATINDPNYLGTQTATLTIQKAAQTFTFAPTLSKNVGGTETLTTSGNQGVNSFSVVSVAGNTGAATINSTTKVISYTAPGTVRVRATVAETTNYALATQDKDIVVSCGGTSTNVGGQCVALVCTPNAVTSCPTVVNGVNGGFVNQCNSSGTTLTTGTCSLSCNSGYTPVGGQCVTQVCTPNAVASCPIVANGVNSGSVSTCNANGTASVAGTCTLSCNAGYVPSGNQCNLIPVTPPVTPPTGGTKTKAELLQQLNDNTRILTPAERAALLEKLKQ